MPNSSIFLPFQKLSGGGVSTAKLDSQTGSLLLTSNGGALTALNLTAQGVVKATPGRVGKLIVNAPGTTSGAFALNDCSTVGAIAAANLIWQLAYNATANVEGAVFVLDFPFLVGLVLTVPGGGSPICSISYT